MSINNFRKETLAVNSASQPAAGYVNWVADNLRRNSRNASTIKRELNSTGIQLSYHLGGYSTKDFLTALCEQSSPEATVNGVVIPDDSYDIFLHKSQPIGSIKYSAVIVKRTNLGFSVTGYNISDPYFTIIESEISNNNYVIAVNDDARAIIYRDYVPLKTRVPYGYEFVNTQQVVDFLVSYQRYLQSQGVVFDGTSGSLKETMDFVLSAKEFLTWYLQDWQEGNVIVLSPVADTLKINLEHGTTDQLRNSIRTSCVLDQNFNLVPSNQIDINRYDTTTVVFCKTTATIGLVALDIVEYEHEIVFANQTMFKDIIYQPELGNRQSRIKLLGTKTDGWTGTLHAPGFIINTVNVTEWQADTLYLAGDIVKYKLFYYVALESILSAGFNTSVWQQIDYNQVNQTLLPNLTMLSTMSKDYYDVDIENLNTEIENHAKGLLGFRSRNYFNDLGVERVTQTKFYQSFIRGKGSRDSLLILKNVSFGKMFNIVEFYEDWAFRVGEYGGTDINQFIEVNLKEKYFTLNPGLGSLVNVPSVGSLAQQITAADLYKKPLDYTTDLFLKFSKIYNESYISSAGYVDESDINITVFDIQDADLISTALSTVHAGAVIWCALDYNRDWNVYRISETGLGIKLISNVLDNNIEIEFVDVHFLNEGDVVVIKNFSTLFDGFYRVKSTPTIDSIVVETTADLNGFTSATGAGMFFKLVSLRFENIENSVTFTPKNNWREKEKIWIDNYDGEDSWAVLEKNSPWTSTSNSLTADPYVPVYNTAVTKFGTAVAADANDSNYFIASAAGNKVFLYKKIDGVYAVASTITASYAGVAAFGASLDYANSTLVVGDPAANNRLGSVSTYIKNSSDQFIADQYFAPTTAAGALCGYAVKITANYLLVGAPGINAVYVYKRNAAGIFAFLQQIVNPSINGTLDRAGHSIDMTSAEDKIYIGAPYAEIDRIHHAGRVLVYTLYNGLFQFAEKIEPKVTIKNAEFGSSIKVCSRDCSLFVGAPGVSFESSYRTGQVYRFTNLGRLIGTVKSREFNGAIGANNSLIINGVEVLITGAIQQIGTIIQVTAIPNVYATVDNNVLTITSKSIIDAEKLSVLPGNGTAYTDLGLRVIQETQILPNPISRNLSKFGNELDLSADNSQLFVSSPLATTLLHTIFDEDLCIFDNTSTVFVDEEIASGSVSVFQYIKPLKLTQNNLGSYIFGQQLESIVISAADQFGCSLAVSGNTVFVGASADDPVVDGKTWINAGTVQIFKNLTNQTLWHPIKTAQPLIDIDIINQAYIYNKQNNNIISFLDIVDPLKGRILGLARQDIDYITDRDPAVYDRSVGAVAADVARIDEGSYWADNNVGKYWLDTASVRFVDYEQQTLDYRTANWSRVFPGSEVKVYQWIASDVIPSQYSTKYIGTPRYANNESYVLSEIVDKNTGATIKTYYYWVRGLDTIPALKGLSTATVESYIANPKASGFPYLVMYSPTDFGLYNIAESVDADNTVLHIDYDVQNNDNIIHSEYELVQEDLAASAPPGRIIKKFIDSLVGKNLLNQPVPDPTLIPSERYGLEIRPRQTLFVDRTAALKNFVDSVNRIFKTLFIADSVAATTGFKNSSTLWKYVPWVKPGFDLASKPEYVIDRFHDLQRRTYLIGTVIKIKNNGQGYYSVIKITTDGYDLLAQEHATIELLPAIYAANASAPTVRKLIESIFYELFVDDMAIYNNQLFFVLVRYVLGEQKYIDWAFKTSFITVAHTAVKFEQFTNYQPDNQDYLLDYLYEAKPYHTKIREYKPAYTGRTDANIGITDFDLPAYYDTNLSRFRPPSGEQSGDALLINTRDEYYAWNNSHKFAVGSVTVVDGGQGYFTAPEITFVGGGGSGATALATVSGGAITKITITNSGDNYLTPPSVIINGVSQIDEVVKVAGAISFNGVNQYLYTSASSAFAFGTGDFTVECWIYPTSSNSVQTSGLASVGGRITNRYSPGGAAGTWGFNFSSSNFSFTEVIVGEPGVSASALPTMLNKWTHLAVSRSGTTLRLFANGVLVGSGTNSTNFNSTSNPLAIGSSNGTGPITGGETVFPGYISNVRIIKGTAVYTAPFTPPTTVLPAIAGTSLLLNVADSANFIKDSSGNQFSITNVGDATWTANGPFKAPVGVGATLSVRLKNSTVRQFSTVIKYDRITYKPTDLDGYDTANYDVDQYDTHNIELDTKNALDRVRDQYQHAVGAPGSEYSLLFDGIEFPGYNLKGAPTVARLGGFDIPDWDGDSFDTGVKQNTASDFDMYISSSYSDLTLGTRAEDIAWQGGQYVDPSHSHAPQELIPGIMFDTLDLKVVHLSQNKGGREGSGIPMNIYSFLGTGQVTRFSFNYANTSTFDVILVYSQATGKLIANTNYSINYYDRIITFVTPPANNEIFYLYVTDNIGTGQIFDKSFVSDGATKLYYLPTVYSQAKYVLTLVDGVKTIVTKRSISGGIELELAAAPPAGAKIHFEVFDSSLSYPTSELRVETKPVSANTRTYTLNIPVETTGPREGQSIVTLNGLRLTPPSYTYYYGDGTTTRFTVVNTLKVPTNAITVKVYLDGVQCTPGVQYTTSGVGADYVVNFAIAPPKDSEIDIGNLVRAEFVIDSGTSLVIANQVTLADGDELSIISFTDSEPLKIRTQVFVGNTKFSKTILLGYDSLPLDEWNWDSNKIQDYYMPYYTLSRPVNDTALLWVTVDGVKIFPNRDYIMYDNVTLEILNTVKITSNSPVVVSSLTEAVAARPLAFRIFKNMINEYSYYRMALVNSTYLSQDLLITDTVIHVVNAAVLDAPSPSDAVPGVIFINGERITYYEKDNTTNTLGNIRRGTGGTGAPAIQEAGRQVIGASKSQLIKDAHNKVWYDYTAGTDTGFDSTPWENLYFDPTNGTLKFNHNGLENQSTAPAIFLKEEEGLFLDR